MDLPDVPVSALNVKGAKVVVSLELYQCTKFSVEFSAEGITDALRTGQMVARRVNAQLTRKAVRDHAAFEHLREKLRATVIEGQTGRPLKQLRNMIGFDDYRQPLAFALLWLALYEPGHKRRVLRYTAYQCLKGSRAVIQIGCGVDIAYVTSVGENPKDLTPMFELAATSPPLAILNRTPRTG